MLRPIACDSPPDALRCADSPAEFALMEPLPRRPGASSRPEHGSYLPNQPTRGTAGMWLPIVLAILLLIIGGAVWMSL